MNTISFVLLILIGIAILGPDKLPNGLEFLWLNVTNFLRSQNGQPVLEVEEARAEWKAKDSPIFTVVQLLRAATEHLLELRKRIFAILIAMVVAAVVAGVSVNYILTFLTRPVGGVQLIALRPTEMFMIYIKVILATALALTIPVIVFHVLRFIQPALETEKEIKLYRTVVLWAIPFSGLFFLGGGAFAYFVMMPFSLNYLGSFGEQFATAQWNITEYISFILTMLLWVGLSFETPLAMFVLSKAGIVSGQKFASIRKFAYVGIAGLAAFITPTPDAFNMLLVMAPLLGLYELGVFLAKLA
jgi:sec-independent protein translocase protein TatC